MFIKLQTALVQMVRLPVVREGADIETESRTDAHDILVVQLLQDRCLASVIEAANHAQRHRQSLQGGQHSQEQDAHLLLLLPTLTDDGKETHVQDEAESTRRV